jgi:hydrogenase nickel incorporation protein HypA/HybF
MHELSVVTSLFEILEEKTRGHAPCRITAVKIRVGRLSGVVPDLLQSAFEIYKKGTMADGATLEIESVPFRFRCRRCGSESFPEEPPYACAGCGSSDIELLGGMDLVVDRIEIETDD